MERASSETLTSIGAMKTDPMSSLIGACARKDDLRGLSALCGGVRLDSCSADHITCAATLFSILVVTTSSFPKAGYTRNY